MNKGLVVLLLILGLSTLLLTSCGKTTGSAGQKEEVIFWHALGGPLGDALTKLVDEFNSTHPNIHIKAISVGNYQALSQKLMASIQADQQPDISQVYESWTANLMEGNVIKPMSDFIKEDASFTDKKLTDFYPVFIESNTFNNQLVTFPFNKSVQVMFYNKDAFLKAGLDPNKPPKTWAEFRDVCKKLTKDANKDGNPEVFGTTFTISAWQFENLLVQAGGNLMKPDGTTPDFNSPQGIEAVTYISDLLNKDKTAYLSTGYEGQNDFLAGKVAIYQSSSVSLAHMKKQKINFNMGIAAIPTYKTSKNFISGTNVAIFRNKKDPNKEKAAWEFVKWFTDTKQAATWSKLTNYMPLRKSSMDSAEIKDMLKTYPELNAVYAQLDNAVSEPQKAAWFESRKYLEEKVLEKVIRQTSSPKAALDSAAKEIGTLMKK